MNKTLLAATLLASIALTGCTSEPANPGDGTSVRGGTNVPDDIIADPAPEGYQVDTPTTILQQFPRTDISELDATPATHPNLPCLTGTTPIKTRTTPYSQLTATTGTLTKNNTITDGEARYMYVYGLREDAHSVVDTLNKTPETRTCEPETADGPAPVVDFKKTMEPIKVDGSIIYIYTAEYPASNQEDTWTIIETNNVVFSQWKFGTQDTTKQQIRNQAITNAATFCYYRVNNPCTAEEIPALLPLG